ncbi:MAG: hypothetical protein II707_08705, partial [Spirochaetales bacterium]|nr:hypothetical protein [Spirochaetales bacterium]
DCCLFYRFVIIHCESYYLTIEILTDSEGDIRTDRERAKLIVSGSGLTVNLDCFDTEDDALLSMWRYHLPEYHWHNFAVGVVIDYQDKRADTVVYADICHRLECQNILLIVNNYQSDASNRIGLLLDTLKNRAALCGGKLILEYDGRVMSPQTECDFIMMRAGQKLELNGVTFLDVLGESGYNETVSQLRDCMVHGEGIRYKMLFENDGELDFDKIMVHSDSNLIEYRTSIGQILTAMEQLTEPVKDGYRFVRNVFASSSANLDMVLPDNIGDNPINMCEQIIRQGYLNITIESDISGMMTDIWLLSEKLLPLFMTQTFIVTQDFVQKISVRDDLFQYFNDVVSFRQSLDILYYNIYNNHNGLDIYPYKTFCRGKKPIGLILNDTLYVGLSVRSLMRKMFTLPNMNDDSADKSGSKWYDIANRCVLSSGSYLNKTKLGLHYFLADNHILILREPNVSKDRYDDLRIIIFCTQHCRMTIAESEDILHKFDVNVVDGAITIEYETNPVSRMVTFEIVLSDDDSIYTTKSVNYNGDEIFCSQDGIVMQFMSSNILAENVIKIM